LVLAVGGALTIAAVLAVAAPALLPESSTSAQAVTPPVLSFHVDGRHGPTVLREIAASLQRQPVTDQRVRATGALIEREGYALATAVGGDAVASGWITDTTTTEVTPTTLRMSVQRGAPRFADAAAEQRWRDLDAGDTTAPAPQVREEPVPGDIADWYAAPPLTGPALLDGLLHTQPDRSTLTLLTAITDTAASKVLEPVQRADLFTELAGRADLDYQGTTTDRASRPALAFSHDSDRSGLPTRYVLLISPTGDLLSYEQILTQDPGRLNVVIPATVSYTLYRGVQYRG
jgi:hypothetical protein